MKVSRDFSQYKPWSGAEATYDKVVEAKKLDKLEMLLEQELGECADETDVNDMLWFHDDFILECLGIETEDE